jgi:hypothetical protein
MPYFVSRQHYWPDGNFIVEVASGGLDYANPDMLVAKYPRLGEGETYDDPREAVQAAIAVARAWRLDSGKKIAIGTGCTMGFTMPFEASSQKAAIAWAERVYEKLPKCDGCQGLMGKEKWSADDWSGEEFCSDRCATKAMEFNEAQEAEARAQIGEMEASDE